MAFPATEARGDTELRLWKKILGQIQNAGGALAANNPKRGDTKRVTMAKELRAMRGSSSGKL